MIIVIKEQDRVVMAVSNSDNLFNISYKDKKNKENIPIVVKDNVIYGFCVANRYSDIFSNDKDFLSGEVSEESLLKETLPYMFNRVKQEKRIDVDETWEEPNWGNSCVIIAKDKLFSITPKFYLREISDYVCHGYDTEKAYGALEQNKGQCAEERIKATFKLLKETLDNNYYPIAVVDSKNKEIQFWEEE